MTKEEVRIGMRVRITRVLFQVPTGTEGVVDEEYDGGFMIAWDKPNPGEIKIPDDYIEFILTMPRKTSLVMNEIYRSKYSWSKRSRPLRDGFAYNELDMLEPVIGSVEVKHDLEL